MTMMPMKKCGRLVLLGEVLDTEVQQYLRRVREGGVLSQPELQRLLQEAFCHPVTSQG